MNYLINFFTNLKSPALIRARTTNLVSVFSAPDFKSFRISGTGRSFCGMLATRNCDCSARTLGLVLSPQPVAIRQQAMASESVVSCFICDYLLLSCESAEFADNHPVVTSEQSPKPSATIHRWFYFTELPAFPRPSHPQQVLNRRHRPLTMLSALNRSLPIPRSMWNLPVRASSCPRFRRRPSER